MKLGTPRFREKKGSYNWSWFPYGKGHEKARVPGEEVPGVMVLAAATHFPSVDSPILRSFAVCFKVFPDE